MGEAEIREFLNHLATEKNVAASTQNQALCALIFLYREVLHKEIGEIEGLIWARKPKRLPTVYSRDEVKSILSQLTGARWLTVSLLYGSGLRLQECLRLRVKDIDFEYKQLIKVKKLHERDLKNGFGSVEMPNALVRKYPNAQYDYIDC